MKQTWKKLITLILAGVLALSLAACGRAEEEQADTAKSQEQYEQIKDSLEKGAKELTEMLTSLTEEERESYKNSNDSFTVAAVQAWEDVVDETGALSKVLDISTANEEDSYTALVLAECENETVEFTYTYDKDTGMATNIAVNVQYSLATNMSRAGMNTLMGLGIVFLVLIFLSFIISLFKHVNKAVTKEEKPVPKPEPAPVVMAEEEEDVTDDLELVAVITAAIAASQQTSADGFVVRSIKKVNRSKWRRA